MSSTIDQFIWQLEASAGFHIYSPYYQKYVFPRSHAAKDGTRYVELHPNNNDRTLWKIFTTFSKGRGVLEFKMGTDCYGKDEYLFVSNDKKKAIISLR